MFDMRLPSCLACTFRAPFTIRSAAFSLIKLLQKRVDRVIPRGFTMCGKSLCRSGFWSRFSPFAHFCSLLIALESDLKRAAAPRQVTAPPATTTSPATPPASALNAESQLRKEPNKRFRRDSVCASEGQAYVARPARLGEG